MEARGLLRILQHLLKTNMSLNQGHSLCGRRSYEQCLKVKSAGRGLDWMWDQPKKS